MSLLKLLTLAGTPPTPPEPDPLPLAWRNIADYARPSTSGTNGWTAATTRTLPYAVKLLRDATQVTLTYSAVGGNLPELPDGPLTYTATIDGDPVTWAGQPSGTCQPGDAITSDPVTVDVTAGDTVTISTTVTTTGTKVPTALYPLRVNALSDRPSAISLGSSSANSGHYVLGFSAVGLPLTNASVPASRAPDFTNTILDRLDLTNPHHGWTHAFQQVGINSNAYGAAEMCQGAVDLAWRLRAHGISYVAQKVWKPHTSSTDGWTSLEGQTPRYPARAHAVAWLRAGAPVTADGRTYLSTAMPGARYVGEPGHPFDAVVDWSAPLEAPGDPDRFRTDQGQITGDGLHITPAGYALARPPLTAWAATVEAAHA